MYKQKYVEEVGALDRKIAGAADSKHSTFKCLVNTVYICKINSIDDSTFS